LTELGPFADKRKAQLTARKPEMALTRHCWKCGAEYKLPGGPGRLETCEQCGADLKVCRNCASYDPRVAHQCRDRRADPVAEKHLANYCEYFEMIRREFTAPHQDASDLSRETKARDALKKLLGD
jgi:ribosome-binding protein aMBF1 (putative translation factor)